MGLRLTKPGRLRKEFAEFEAKHGYPYGQLNILYPEQPEVIYAPEELQGVPLEPKKGNIPCIQVSIRRGKAKAGQIGGISDEGVINQDAIRDENLYGPRQLEEGTQGRFSDSESSGTYRHS